MHSIVYSSICSAFRNIYFWKDLDDLALDGQRLILSNYHNRINQKRLWIIPRVFFFLIFIGHAGIMPSLMELKTFPRLTFKLSQSRSWWDFYSCYVYISSAMTKLGLVHYPQNGVQGLCFDVIELRYKLYPGGFCVHLLLLSVTTSTLHEWMGKHILIQFIVSIFFCSSLSSLFFYFLLLSKLFYSFFRSTGEDLDVTQFLLY